MIGITDSHRQFFQPDVLGVIARSSVFSGGKRHREIMSDYLPDGSTWIDVTVPLSAVYQKYREHERIVVFASGDPLFFGFGATLQREFPNADIEVFPAFNSLQMLAHRLKMPYQDMVNVSLTGRPWKNLDDALISGFGLVGCLTDRSKGPAEIARRMLDYGYDNYSMSVGTSLGNEEKESVVTLTLDEAAEGKFGNPNCVILRMTHPRHKYFGIPESEFHHLQGREKMITKMPIRLLSLSMLDLADRLSLWDIGFCTGSVSIEARLQFPHLDITTFEVREESRALIEKNCRKFGAPGINSVIGDFLAVDVSEYRRPDAVFIGGHGGRLAEIVRKAKEAMLPGGVIVFNSVSPESCEMFQAAVESVGMAVIERHVMALDSFNPITILKAQ